LPPTFTYGLANAGSTKVKVTLNTTGSQTVTATDTNNSSITGTSRTITVSAGPPPGRSSGSGDSADAAVEAAASQVLGGSVGTALVPAVSAFVSTDAGTHGFKTPLTAAGGRTLGAAEPAGQLTGMATGTVPAAVRGGQSLDGEAKLLDPAGVAAFFALDESTQGG
jgi:hypothetical protein